jgi:hypothetical protein
MTVGGIPVANSDKKTGAALVRVFERRMVWLAIFAVNRIASSNSLNSSVAKSADEGLKEYEGRFPEITPDIYPD